VALEPREKGMEGIRFAMTGAFSRTREKPDANEETKFVGRDSELVRREDDEAVGADDPAAVDAERGGRSQGTGEEEASWANGSEMGEDGAEEERGSVREEENG